MNTIRRKFFEPLVTSSQRANRQAGPWKYLAWFIGSGDESQGRKKTSSKNPPIGEPLPWDSQRDIYVSMYINWSQENNIPPLWVLFFFFFSSPFSFCLLKPTGGGVFQRTFSSRLFKNQNMHKRRNPGRGRFLRSMYIFVLLFFLTMVFSFFCSLGLKTRLSCFFLVSVVRRPNFDFSCGRNASFSGSRHCAAR